MLLFLGTPYANLSPHQRSLLPYAAVEVELRDYYLKPGLLSDLLVLRTPAPTYASSPQGLILNTLHGDQPGHVQMPGSTHDFVRCALHQHLASSLQTHLYLQGGLPPDNPLYEFAVMAEAHCLPHVYRRIADILAYDRRSHINAVSAGTHLHLDLRLFSPWTDGRPVSGSLPHYCPEAEQSIRMNLTPWEFDSPRAKAVRYIQDEVRRRAHPLVLPSRLNSTAYSTPFMLPNARNKYETLQVRTCHGGLPDDVIPFMNEVLEIYLEAFVEWARPNDTYSPTTTFKCVSVKDPRSFVTGIRVDPPAPLPVAAPEAAPAPETVTVVSEPPAPIAPRTTRRKKEAPDAVAANA